MKVYTLPEIFLTNGQRNATNVKQNETVSISKENEPNLQQMWGDNPFKVPPDTEWVDLCQAEKLRARRMRRHEREKKAHEKHTFQSRYSGTTLPAIRHMFKELDEEINKELRENQKRPNADDAATMTSQKCRVRPVEREFTHELIERKREMFLVNFALQTKKDEISEYKTKEIEEEKKVRQTAERLHQDAVMFDDFLKATDEAAVDAMKNAERETRLKMEKTAELRRMQVKLGAVKADISKKDDLLADYLSYKSFLLQLHYNLTKTSGHELTSDEWNVKIEKERKKKKAMKTKRNKFKLTEEKPKRRPSYLMRRSSFNMLSKKAQAKPTKQHPLPPVPSKLAFSKTNYPEEWADDGCESDKQTKQIAYLLEDPKHLVNVIRDMEEENLKLIYHFQHSEEGLDDLKHAHVVSKKRINKETKQLRDQVDRMRIMIEDAESRSKNLKVMCKILDEGVHENGDAVLEDLNWRVENVYTSVVGRLIVNIDSLVMLACIENKMEELLDEIETLPAASVKEVQKVKDKERRLVLREEKLAYQRLRQEERAKRAQNRANTTSFKKVGRKLVFRSEPIRGRGTTKVTTEGLIMSDSQLFLEKD